MSKRRKVSLVGWIDKDWDLIFYNCSTLMGSKCRKQIVHECICQSKKRLSIPSYGKKIRITIEEV